MKHGRGKALILSLLLIAAFSISGCGHNSAAGGARETSTSVLSPEASGTVILGSGAVSMDVSNADQGYIMVKYQGSASKIKIQITGPDNNTYTYTSHPGDYETFPLTVGSGNYSVAVLENIQGSMYSMISSESFAAGIDDEFSPFLYPNQYVWFTADSEAVNLARTQSEKSSDDLNFVENVYTYVTRHISYDDNLAANVPVDYIPCIDDTLRNGKGICFDYASLMAAMLRSQSIPTKLVVGYSGTAYHAWISVYLKETGWVDNIIEFDGQNWSIMDPTLGSTGSSSQVRNYVGDGSNYIAQYHY